MAGHAAGAPPLPSGRGDALAGSAGLGAAQPVSHLLASGDLGTGRHAGPLPAQSTGPAHGEDCEQAFDLNIEKVLEHWTVAFAIRELIANALDEQALTGTASRRSSRTPLDTGMSRTRVEGFGTST